MKNFALVSLLTASVAFAQIPAEMDGMEYETRADGTFLIGGPTYAFDRPMSAGGLHSESELWTPAKMRDRLLFNRWSGTPSWTPLEPGIWVKTGNELGDLIYQDFITENDDRPENRTPILEGGFRSPSYKGLWATARFFQDDHFCSGAYAYRRDMVDGNYTHLGANWAMFSTAYGGLGYTNSLVNASVLAGEEYLWFYTASSHWVPAHYKPRVEARADIKDLSVTVAYEDIEFENLHKKEEGARKEVNGSVYYKCGKACQQKFYQIAAGVAFRAVDDEGTVYTELEEDRVMWSFLEMRVQPLQRLTADVTFGVNERDWLVQDSIQYLAPAPENMGVVVGVKNISGSRLNPLADTKEFYDGREIDLTADGQMNLIQAYASYVDTLGGFVSIGGRGSIWAEHGAETFDVDEYDYNEEYGLNTRFGNVSRVDAWIKGLSAEMSLNTWYRDMFKFTAMAGFEHIDGPIDEAEVTPAEFYTGFMGDWLLNKTFKISHSLRYRSDAKWNLRSKDPMVVKGDWTWDASFSQQFPKYGISLTGTLMHVLADEEMETVNGGYDRIRFICQAKKTF
ncbi:hypothetical protein SAMN05720487_10962 [Fibrobacter sp. UWT2]|uniref:hypothetical protein n=1 Tax=Fibrobacter sp. UWT2 TaxID=1896224 RepID=UPI00091E40D5|nr:hypothetical protein [Fibrobacter sp. UWT2]SHL19943.1 hypothetical protein SAMN05720487_10962 [Fibrobacter sp. UWT2]